MSYDGFVYIGDINMHYVGCEGCIYYQNEECENDDSEFEWFDDHIVCKSYEEIEEQEEKISEENADAIYQLELEEQNG
jgi:hypothetical protein